MSSELMKFTYYILIWGTVLTSVLLSISPEVFIGVATVALVTLSIASAIICIITTTVCFNSYVDEYKNAHM